MEETKQVLQRGQRENNSLGSHIQGGQPKRDMDTFWSHHHKSSMNSYNIIRHMTYSTNQRRLSSQKAVKWRQREREQVLEHGRRGNNSSGSHRSSGQPERDMETLLSLSSKQRKCFPLSCTESWNLFGCAFLFKLFQNYYIHNVWCDNNTNMKYFSPHQHLSFTESESEAMRMSFSVAISINASKLSDERVLLSLLLINFKIENVRSQATCVTDHVSRYL